MVDQPDREAEPNFSRPFRQIFLMSFVLACVAGLVVVLFPSVAPTFLANWYLNGFIAFVFVLGVAACYIQTWQLWASVNWLTAFAAGKPGAAEAKSPRLLGPMASLLKSRGSTMQISSTSARSILDSVATRIDELRDITRYIVNLLIFLGLLGTFYGLATTVPAIVDTISNLEPRDGETGADVFRRLQSGLEAQMGGMGIAFASSLLGLAGSLVVGLLELFAGHGQNRFYRELEEWLSTITRLGFAGAGDGEGGGADQGALVQVLESMASQMEHLQGLVALAEANRTVVEERLGHLTDSINQILSHGDSHDILQRIATSQESLVEIFETQGTGGSDAESRMRLRSIDVQLLRILEEMAAGRQETTTDLRSDIAALTKAVRQLTR